MNTDIRLDVGFFQNLKTKKTIARLGTNGVLGLLRVWLWAAVNAPDGDLSKLSDEDLECVAEWDGEPGKFVETLRSLHWIDKPNQLHEWREFQTWASTVEDRENASRMAALAYRNPEAYKRAKADGKKALSKKEYAEYVGGYDIIRKQNNGPSNRSSPCPCPCPSPSPIPSPIPFPAPNSKTAKAEKTKAKDETPLTAEEVQGYVKQITASLSKLRSPFEDEEDEERHKREIAKRYLQGGG